MGGDSGAGSRVSGKKRGRKWRAVYLKIRGMAFERPPGSPLGRTILQPAADFGVNPKTVRRAVEILKIERNPPESR